MHGAAALTVQELAPGTAVCSLTGTITHLPDTYTIQIGAYRHLLPDGQLWRYLNHSCSPNCRIDFSTWTLVTTRAIQCNAELTFNYLTTEWDMTAPFMCQCGALNCYGYVAGFHYLTPAQQVVLAPRCSPLVRRLWCAQATSRPRVSLAGWQPEVHVWIPYATTDGRIESPSHDTPAYRAEVQSWFEALQLPWRWVPVTLARLAQTLAAVCAPGQKAPALVCNLCDGDEVHGYPGASVVRALEQASIPFTGAASTFYALSTSKIAMKERLRQCKIATPSFVCLGNRSDDMARLTTHVGYPAMIKPAVSAASTRAWIRGRSDGGEAPARAPPPSLRTAARRPPSETDATRLSGETAKPESSSRRSTPSHSRSTAAGSCSTSRSAGHIASASPRRMPGCTPCAAAAAVTAPTSGSVPGTGASAAGSSCSRGRSSSAARSSNPGVMRHAITGTYVLYPNTCSCQTFMCFRRSSRLAA